MIRRVATAASVLGGLVMAPPAAGGQSPDVTVRVRVTDTAAAPIAGAEVTVIEGLKDVRARGITDESGRITLVIKRDDGQRELIVRRIGLARSSVFFRPVRDTIALMITMHRPTQILDVVTVTERENVKRKSYHVDADQIAAATRPIMDGMDILTKLRPDILYGRMPGCGVQNVWINGKLIRGVMSNDMVQARRGLASRNGKNAAGRSLPAPKLLSANEAALTIMASIKPEHVEEMNFLDCFDKSIHHTHGNAALYVVLKQGIGFEVNGRGSYVADLKDFPLVAATPDSVEDLSWRRRVLGVFDEATGDPISGVAVRDSASGLTATTTATGTISLAFLPEGTSKLIITKPGYRDLTMVVMISPRETAPVTLVLSKPE